MHANRISESPRRKLGGVVDALQDARVNERLNAEQSTQTNCGAKEGISRCSR